MAFGSIRYEQDYSLGVKGWSFQAYRSNENTLTQKHVHIWGPNHQEWSQNEDGSPHDKDRNTPGDPRSMRKELKKQIGWD